MSELRYLRGCTYHIAVLRGILSWVFFFILTLNMQKTSIRESRKVCGVPVHSTTSVASLTLTDISVQAAQSVLILIKGNVDLPRAEVSPPHPPSRRCLLFTEYTEV